MGLWDMVVAVVLIGGLVQIVKARQCARADRDRDRDRDEPAPYALAFDEEAERLRRELRQVKDRVAVLERIVTDGDHERGRALEREIEALCERREADHG